MNRGGVVASRVLLGCLGLLGISSGTGAQSMQPVLVNGPVSNRYSLVALAEGYTSAQLAQFGADATNAINALLSHPPLQEYRSYFNGYAILIASAESGSDHPAANSYKNTYFNSAYDAGSDYFITIPSGGLGQGRVDALLQTLMPSADLSILLVNDFTPGGSDGFNQTAISYARDTAFNLLTHEVGHVAANLGDEYEYANPGFPDTEEPNTTRQTNYATLKWKAWVSTNTPLPTPPTYAYNSTVGVFEGAHYHTTGWYRPRLNCLMRDDYTPFCEVCSEALVLALYGKVRPVDSFSPAATNLGTTSSQALEFSVTPLQPATHALAVQWLTNGVTVPGATNVSFSVLPAALGGGAGTVSATVRDTTGLVRTDPGNLLRQTVTWNVNVALLRFDFLEPLPANRLKLRVSGSASQGVVIKGSTNLVSWFPIATNLQFAGQWWFTNTTPATFFRAVTPP